VTKIKTSKILTILLKLPKSRATPLTKKIKPLTRGKKKVSTYDEVKTHLIRAVGTFKQ